MPSGAEWGWISTSGTATLAARSGPLPLVARVLVGADIVPGPAVKGAWFDAGSHNRAAGRRPEYRRSLTTHQSAPPSGCTVRPEQLRKPAAKTLAAPALGIEGEHVGAVFFRSPGGAKRVTGLERRQAGRPAKAHSCATFEPEPTDTNIVLPSAEKAMSRVQWPPPPGSDGTMV